MSTEEHPPRLLLVAAFSFPVPQGSQVFVAEQARALAATGASVELLCYGRGDGADPGFPVKRIPDALTPRSQRAGPRAGKPLADAALLAALVRRAGSDSSGGCDAVLAHNAEAACIALAARPWLGVPVLYVAHTLLERELPQYARSATRGAWRALGRRLDRGLAARADAVIALSDPAAEVLGRTARGPVDRIPPGLTPRPPPSAEEIEACCDARDLVPGRFALYAGNLDAYQDLDTLAVAAATLPDLPIVAATHDPPRRLGRVRCVRVKDERELRTLTHAAGVAVLPRRVAGGFPIKLLNYMEAARPIVAREGLGTGLVAEREAWLVPDDAGGEAFAEAIFALIAHPHHAAELGAAARRALEVRHAWPELAGRTLERVRMSCGS